MGDTDPQSTYFSDGMLRRKKGKETESGGKKEMLF